MDSTVTLDVGRYEDRLKLLEILEEAYPAPRGFRDPMQGDRIQTEWQLASGRALNPWWNRINYALTVWRIEALKSRGEFPQVQLAGNFQVPLPENVRADLLTYYDGIRAIQVVDDAAESHVQSLFWMVHEDTVTAATSRWVGAR